MEKSVQKTYFQRTSTLRRPIRAKKHGRITEHIPASAFCFMKSIEKNQVKPKLFKLKFGKSKISKQSEPEEMESMEDFNEWSWNDTQILLRKSPKFKRRNSFRKTKITKPLGKLCSKVGKLFN